MASLYVRSANAIASKSIFSPKVDISGSVSMLFIDFIGATLYINEGKRSGRRFYEKICPFLLLFCAFSLCSKVCCIFFKKIKKSLKKVLTRENNCSIIDKLHAWSSGKNCSLKIEQHEISSTEKCRDLVNTLWKKETHK